MSTNHFSEILAAHGVTASSVARGLNINKSSIARWKQCPAERVAEVSKITGIPREKIRPDLAAVFAPRPRARKPDMAQAS